MTAAASSLTPQASSLCTCPGPGYCPVFQRPMSEHLVQICRGQILAPEKCEAYRANWRANPILQSPTAPREPRTDCRHFGAELRRQQCETCCGKVVLKVFACALRGECTPEKPLAGVPCCGGCHQYEAK